MVHAGGTFHPARSRKLPSLIYPNGMQGQAHFGVEAWLLGRQSAESLSGCILPGIGPRGATSSVWKEAAGPGPPFVSAACQHELRAC
jgi:hypothetical protein